ncbi:MAG: hypothetical protein M5R36_24965 [Deltaproteobacteria bacterium]|nr:hypothetical protein [Deltaproteobacteria bacterium]
MRAAILDYAAVLHDMYVTIPIVLATQNNHAIKFASGLGAVGMLFNDTREAALYVNFALATAPWILFDFQMAPGGGQGEGPNYLDYTLQTFWPLRADVPSLRGRRGLSLQNDLPRAVAGGMHRKRRGRGGPARRSTPHRVARLAHESRHAFRATPSRWTTQSLLRIFRPGRSTGGPRGSRLARREHPRLCSANLRRGGPFARDAARPPQCVAA